ncbi:hypothetical protein Nepgr_004514 [Nepenthes gracilis]|uniref:CNH domain-containing protein n=1 Tax=Nepenthes gracilis TaxID=150966 RepID=A0AAD3S1I7_NEPGR|nr:hypothetical protein Nepgr_004514 [Nepenthes gracilis]
MEKLEPSKARTVIELLAEFDLSQASLPPSSHSPPPSFCSLAISTLPDSQTLIYVGTDSGALFLLSVDSNFDLPSPSSFYSNKVRLLRFVSVSNGAIHSIHVVSQIGKILVVSDGHLYLINSLLLQPVKKLGLLNGVMAVARRVYSSDSESSHWIGAGRISENSSVSKRLLKKIGGGIRSNGVKIKDLELNSSEDSNCIFAVATGKKIVLIEFILGNRFDRSDEDVDGSFVVLKEIQWALGVKTMVWLDDAIIVGGDSGYYLISCITGQCALIFSLPDASGPPRLKLLLKNFKVLLLVDNVGIFADSHGQPVSGSLIFRRAPDSIGELSLYVAIVRDGKIELYHKKSGACVQGLSFGGTGVGRCVLANEEVSSGSFLAVATPSKVVCYRKMCAEEQIKDLLRKKNFVEAISLAEELEGEGEITKEMLSFVHAQVGFLLLFDLHFEKAVDHFLLAETMQPSELFPFIMRDPNRWSLLVPRNRYWGLHPPPAHIEDVVEDGLLAIDRAIFLRKAGVETAIDEEFLLNPPTRTDLLQSAFKNIIRYLQVSRDKDLSPSVREGVDTLLMYLYRSLNYVDEMEKLASSENSCILEELDTLLEDSGHLRALAFLYANKGVSSKALAIWRVLARNYSSGLWRESVEENDLKDTSVTVISGRRTAAIEASKILEESSDEDLILQHLGWISDVDQELAVQVLTSEIRTNQLLPDDVITAIDPRKVEVLQRYLQWLIEDQGSNDSQFHTLYALSLAKSALEALESESATENADNRRIKKMKNYDYENNAIFDSPVRERLQIFLDSSDLYEPEDVLELIGESELWLEKAILYRKLGQELLVLQILALKLEDCEAAEQYCAELGRPDAYMQLLDMYLDPQNGKEPMFTAAVRLLHNHGESLDPLQVLERLSPDMPLQLASDTILRMLRARLHHHRQGQIVHNLSQAVDIDVRLARLEERARHIQISDESMCDSCHAHLGTKLFAMYPDDSIVCYKCFRRQGESTSVTGRNFKRDVLFKPGWLVSR